MDDFTHARMLLQSWKGSNYHNGTGSLEKTGESAKTLGDQALIVTNGSPWIQGALKEIQTSLDMSCVRYSIVSGSGPNAPLEDLYRIALQTSIHKPSSILAFGSGSTIDACKAASVLATYGPEEVAQALGIDWREACRVDPYFGTGLVTKLRDATRKDPIAVLAVQTGASSAAHLTKYSNITDSIRGQKKLIVDDAITPREAFFDYDVTLSAPPDLTIDGGLDGIAHCWEVFMGSTGKDYYTRLETIVPLSLRLIINHLPRAVKEPRNKLARTGLGLGTDLGGYAIMIGGTNGPHLGSFSLVDALTHGRACGLLLPYYTVLFSEAIQRQLQAITPVYKRAGLLEAGDERLEGRRLAEAVATAMLRFSESLGIPKTLKEAGVTEGHVERMLNAAGDPVLKMKLMNMPLPLDPEKGHVDRYMRRVLEAAFTGDLSRVPVIEHSD
jgi:alcohol dehydrogenase